MKHVDVIKRPLPIHIKMGAVVFSSSNANDVNLTARRSQPQKYAFRLTVGTNVDIIFEPNYGIPK